MTPLERAARAYWRGENDAIRRIALPWNSLDATQKGMIIAGVRAALLAVRQPSMTMVETGVVAIWGDTEIDADMRGDMGAAFTAMVDALLDEGAEA